MQLQRITSKEHPLFDEAWRIYQQSFPDSERRTLCEHLRALADEAFYACAAVEQGRLCAIVYYWQQESFVFLEHLAVDPALRGTSCGTRALQLLLAQSELPLILEIEQPVDEVKRRRRHFYERLGLTVQPYAHRAVAYQKNTVCDALCLMAKPAISQQQHAAFERFFATRVLQYTADGSERKTESK